MQPAINLNAAADLTAEPSEKQCTCIFLLTVPIGNEIVEAPFNYQHSKVVPLV